MKLILLTTSFLIFLNSIAGGATGPDVESVINRNILLTQINGLLSIVLLIVIIIRDRKLKVTTSILLILILLHPYWTIGADSGDAGIIMVTGSIAITIYALIVLVISLKYKKSSIAMTSSEQ